MQTNAYTVRLQALDGVWEVGGVDRKRGIVPEIKSMAADRWGPSTAAFDLRRDPLVPQPDLGAFTPVEIERNGRIVWSGFISETPTRGGADRVISVQCKGWQFHLDDDAYEKAYVHSRLSDWRDQRSFLTADLINYFLSRFEVSSEEGVITIGARNDTVWPTDKDVGVTLDLGPNAKAKRVVVTAKRGPGAGTNLNLFVEGHESPGDVRGALGEYFVSGTAVSSMSQSGTTYAGSVTTPRRYVTIFLDNGGVSYTSTADDVVTIMSVQVFSDAGYESGNASILKASQVVADALDQATILLDADREGIDDTTFSIPELVVGEPQTPREVWSAVNAYHDWVAQIDVSKRPIFKPKPTAPMYEVGSWSALEPEDQSANSGDEIYNRVIVTGTQPDGSPLRLARSAGQAGDALLTPIASPAPVNPSAAVDLTGWTTDGTLTRDTTVVDSAPASFRLAGGQATLTGAFTGTFQAGTTYVLRFRARVASPSSRSVLNAQFGAPTDLAGFSDLTVPLNSFQTYLIVWIPRTTTTSVTFATGAYESVLNVDDLELFVANPTLVDRRGFRRTKILPVNSAMTTDAAQVIGDLWLAAHRTTPYKGTFRMSGSRAVRDPATGAPVELEDLLLHTMELIRDTSAIDPDTGGVGRDGRIAEVTYTPATDEAVVTLDNSRASYEALMARFDLINSAGR